MIQNDLSTHQPNRARPRRLIGMVLLLLGLFVLLVAGASGGAEETAVPGNIQPALLAMAAEQPNTAVRVIIQKSDPAADLDSTITRLGGSVIKDLHIINAVMAKIPAGQVSQLAQSGDARWVSLDGPVESTRNPPSGPEPTTAPANYYLDTLNVRPVWAMGYDGSGIGVAVIDSGVSTDADFGEFISVSFNANSRDPNDVFGHGTHVAGIIAGNGNDSNQFYKGIAPGVQIISLKISDETGMAYESDTVEAMQWVLDNKDSYNIRIVNMSLNSLTPSSYHNSPLSAAAEILWFNKIVVVVSSGNSGGSDMYDTINSAPANDPFVITVGAMNEKGNANRRNDSVPTYSAWGLTYEGYMKPEIYAPGNDIYSVLSDKSTWNTDYPDRCALNCQYFRLSGTSMSAPMVSGAAALLLQAEPNLTPDQVKYRLIQSAGWTAGWKYLDVYAAITTPTTQSANTGIQASQLLWTGNDPITWGSVNWGSVNWGSVNWGSVNWGSVSWEN